MKKQQRFTSERAIHAEINNTLRKITGLAGEAENLDTAGHSYIRIGSEEMVEAGTALLRQAETIRKSSIPRLQSKLDKLKEAMSQFKTPLLINMPGDQGVAL